LPVLSQQETATRRSNENADHCSELPAQGAQEPRCRVCDRSSRQRAVDYSRGIEPCTGTQPRTRPTRLSTKIGVLNPKFSVRFIAFPTNQPLLAECSRPYRDISLAYAPASSTSARSSRHQPKIGHTEVDELFSLRSVRLGGCTSAAGGLCSVGFVGGATTCADYPNDMESMGHAKAAGDAVTLTARPGRRGLARITVRVTPLQVEFARGLEVNSNA